MTEKGKLFTFEGIEGAGKGSQVKLLEERLRHDGCKVSSLKFYEPGGTNFSDMMRSILKINADTDFAKNNLKHLLKHFTTFNLSAMSQTLLFLAARSDQIEKKVYSELEKGYHVILDRSIDSTTAYQGYAQNPKIINWIREANNMIFTTADVVISKTFYIDIPVNVGLKRSRIRDDGKQDYFDKKDVSFFEKVRSGYLNEIKYHKNLPKIDRNYNRLVAIDGNNTVEDVHKDIYNITLSIINK